MRGAELLGLPVTGPEGPIGKVLDVRLVQDGPLLGAFAALRVEGLVVGRRGLASRLGYDRRDTNGPWLVNALVQRITRHNGFVPWTSITWDEHGLTSTEPLRPLPPL